MNETSDNQQKKEKKSFSLKVKNYVKNILDFSSYDSKTILYIIIFIILFGISVYLLYYIYFVDQTFLYVLVVEWFVNPIIRLGIFGIFLFMIVMAIQGLLVPIPSELVLLASGMIWGFWIGGIMGIIGSMAAGLLCYYVAYKGGRPLAEKFVGESALNMADNFIKKYGTGAIVIARLLPFVAFDPISYISGILKYPVKKYTIATFIGSIPRAFFYAFLGATLISHEPGETINLSEIPFERVEAQAALFNNILLIILVILIVIFVCYYLFSIYWEKKNLESNKTP
ncbi:MAG: DedA family protein [Promethearchaeota archaeon]|nr:MAG: DedA family protein [Candidatus Lokiarchaeota archaeon]